MQCLCSPSREDIDRAHSVKNWLDIGVPSFRNLRQIPKRRQLLWFGLALSSLPLHLFYNSAVFTALAVNEYEAFLVF